MLSNYSFSGKIPEKLGDLGIPTIPCSIKNNYVRTTLCDLGAGVSVMPLSLYKRLFLEKLILQISLFRWPTSPRPPRSVFVRTFLLKLSIA